MQWSLKARQVTGLFVTWLDPQTTEKKLQACIKGETGEVLHPERLKTKYWDYSSFYIRADRTIQNILLNSYLWPKGALIKLFRKRS